MAAEESVRCSRAAARGAAAGLFGALLALPLGAAGLGDYNGDGMDDLLLRHADGRWQLLPMAGRGHIAAERGIAYLSDDLRRRFAAVGDFDGDGRRNEVLLRDEAGHWFYYPMHGRYSDPERRGLAGVPRDPVWRLAGVGDLNNDGKDDLLLRHADGRWRFVPMDGRGPIAAERGMAHPSNLSNDPARRFAAIGDFDGDGYRDDVLLRDEDDGRWFYYAMPGGSSDFEAHGPASVPRDPAWQLAGVGDLNSDGKDDLLLRHADGRWQYLPMDGRSHIAAERGIAYLSNDPARRFAAIGDFDGDGYAAEVLLRGKDGGWFYYPMRGRRSDIEGRGRASIPADLAWSLPSETALPVRIPDAGLRAAIESALGKDPGATITQAEMATLTELGAWSKGVADLTGIEFATGLERLRLTQNTIADISPLAGLARLRELSLYDNQVADLSPLAGLARLESLLMNGNEVADISPLAGMTRLKELGLGWNRIADLSPLTNLTGLTDLDLRSNYITDISLLAELTGLSNLDLGWNRIPDLSPLASLTGLTRLGLRRTNVADISVLAGLSRLQWLHLGGNRITDLAPLAELTSLLWLHLDENQIEVIDPLRGLVELRALWLSDNAIEDLSPLGELKSLTELDLALNAISDIAPLQRLTELAILDLSNNRITDISPLAANLGLGEGDEVDLTGNPISEDSVETHVSDLQGRGVVVAYSIFVFADDFPESRLAFIHNDNVLVMQVDEDIAAATVFDDGLPMRRYATDVYAHFQDAFDHLLFFSNLNSIRHHEGSPYYGIYLSVMNDTEGLGQAEYFDADYGSAGKLRGVIHFPYNEALAFGPSLHELQHAWSNYALPTTVGAHWGFSSADGQLGGFDIANLFELGDQQYAAGSFGTFANGGNNPPYSPIELYFAGLLPPEEVPELWVAADGEWLKDGDSYVYTQTGHAVFTAADVRSYSIDDIIAEHGERIPTMADAQWHQRAAVILLTDDERPPSTAQLDLLSDHARDFSLVGADDRQSHNYFEATRGRGTITLDGLGALLKPLAGVPEDLPASYGTPPEPYMTTLHGRCLPVTAFAGAVRFVGRSAGSRR